jgi:hypothetical protein
VAAKRAAATRKRNKEIAQRQAEEAALSKEREKEFFDRLKKGSAEQ